ncbi:MAG TPA: hypothetical protein VHG69_00825 [Thermoleophilaceae bacterium]|nr:hypothetical protein [Thermoleophilaceae bacterium]
MAVRRELVGLATVSVALLAPGPALAAPTPIPQDPTPGDVSRYEGAPASPRRIAAREPPRHPFMAPNGRSNLHNDAFQTDTNWIAGPLGRDMEVLSNAQFADCASVTFDSRGRIVTICVGVEGPRLVMMDARTLDTLHVHPLPPRIPGTGSIFNDFAGGGYFYLDNRDRAVAPTTTRHVFVVAATESGFQMERDYDTSTAVPPGDKIISALPDWSGRIWFISTRGVVGTIEPDSGTVRPHDLKEDISNSFAVDDEGGVYVVTQKALYRFDAAPDGSPSVTWREEYRNSGIAKPGQVHAGSGTTPTVMESGRVAIADNADPMNVVVYRRARSVTGSRVVCTQPVFEEGASATDQSLIAARNSIVVENNYGHGNPMSVNDGRTTTPGLERVDIVRNGRGCRKVWHSDEIAPSVVPKLSVETGLVYTYTKPARDDGTDAWYLTALDFCTGATRYKRLAGTGLGYNNNFAPVTLGPDGTAYVGALGGLVALRDSTRPAGPRANARRGCPARLRLRLRVRYRRVLERRRRCALGRVTAEVVGRDRRRIRGVRFSIGRRRGALDRRRPFRRRVGPRRHRGGTHSHVVRARVRARDGRRVTLRRRFRACARR